MIKSLTLDNFTVFEHATFELSPGLNVVIGENGTGKSHFLKAAYAIMRLYFSLPDDVTGIAALKLHNVFKSEPKYLCRDSNQFTITVKTHHSDKGVEYTPHIKYVDEKTLAFYHIEHAPFFNTTFIPPKETLSIYPNFTALYERYRLAFEETYYDLCKALGGPLLRTLDTTTQQLLDKFEALIGGVAVLQVDHFYFKPTGTDDLMDIRLIAEGHRKIALLAYLIANDSIAKGSILFWDEPEANLNPRLMRHLAAALVVLAQYGVQVILATHSYFFMLEISLLIEKETNVPAHFFSLAKKEGNSVEIEQGKRMADIQTIIALDEELEQCDRDQALYYTSRERRIAS